MTIALALLALLPVLIGFLATGDFPQLLVKPSRSLIFGVFHYRYGLLTLSLVLYLAALVLHMTVAPTSLVFLLVDGVLVMGLAANAFFAIPYVVFPTVRRAPRWIEAQQLHEALPPDAPVLGLEVNGDARAFPLDWIVRSHVVHTVVGGEPVAMTYCGLSHLGKAFRAELDAKPMQLVVITQLENNLVLYDTVSKHLIQQIAGQLSDGKEAGTRLDEYPTRIMPWSAWRALYPATRVFYNPPGGVLDRLVRGMVGGMLRRHFDPATKTPIFPTIGRFDERLHPKSEVIGVSQQGIQKAYALEALRSRQVVNDQVGDLPLVLVCDPTRDIVEVFERAIQERQLTFALVPSAAEFTFQDAQTGSGWNLKGEAISGPAQGQRLKSVPHASRVLWMIWYNFYPDTLLEAAPPDNEVYRCLCSSL
jgi:hypothetical protein